MGLLYIVDLLHNDTIISICARSDIPIPASSLYIAQVRILHSADRRLTFLKTVPYLEVIKVTAD